MPLHPVPSENARCSFCHQESHSYGRVKPCPGWEQHAHAVVREAERKLRLKIDRLRAEERRGYAELMRENPIVY
jgi:hypothetical protein